MLQRLNCLYVKQMLCHMPAVYNVNYLLNKRKCLVNDISSHLLQEPFLKISVFLPECTVFYCPLL